MVRSGLVLAALGVVALIVPSTPGSAADAAHLISLFRFEIAPSKLPRTERAPVSMEVSGSYRTGDGGHPPAARELRLEADRHLALDLKGVPGCKLPTLRPRLSPGEIEAICRKSIVGRGEISADVEFSDQAKTVVKGGLVLFRAADSPAAVDLVAHTFLSAPVAADLVATVDVRRVDKGRIGWEARFSIPKIAGGAGSLTDYSLRIGKRFLSATCVDRFELRAVTFFVDGTSSGERAVRPCSVAEADPRQ